MDVLIREATPDDAETCAQVCYEAFKTISEAHGFPPDFNSPAEAIGLIAYMTVTPGFHCVVAEVEGKVAGSNFLDERGTIAASGRSPFRPPFRTAQSAAG
jgi:hypothetical protein